MNDGIVYIFIFFIVIWLWKQISAYKANKKKQDQEISNQKIRDINKQKQFEINKKTKKQTKKVTNTCSICNGTGFGNSCYKCGGKGWI